MKGLNSVKWSSLLAPEADIPHDISFKVITKNTEQVSESPEDERSTTFQSLADNKTNSNIIQVQAHKFLLASVSPVFMRQFYGSIPAGESVDITDSTPDAFKMMIDYIYQKEGKCVENIICVQELFDVYYLAEKYEVLGWKENIMKRFKVLKVNKENYEPVIMSLIKHSYLEDACIVLEKRVFEFIKVHDKPLELVQAAIDSRSKDVKCNVLARLVSVSDDGILETVKAAHDIVCSDSCLLDDESTIKPVMKSCVREFEEVQKDPLKLSQFVPNPGSHLINAYYLLQQFVKNNFCKNCESSACRKGERNVNSHFTSGARVKVKRVCQSGEIIELGLVQLEKKSRTGHRNLTGSTGCPLSCPCRDILKHCTVCRNQSKSMEVSVNCDGIHRSSDIASGVKLCRIRYADGSEVTIMVDDVVFDC